MNLRQRLLQGVEFVVSDDHAGVRRVIQEVRPEAMWQHYYLRFLRSALDYLLPKTDDDFLQELRRITTCAMGRKHGRISPCGY